MHQQKPSTGKNKQINKITKQTSKQHGMDKHTGQTHAQWSRIENAEQIHILLVN